MKKILKRLAIALILLVFPLSAARATGSVPADNIAASVNPMVKLLQQQVVYSALASKTYTDKKNGFTLKLPTGWKKLPVSSGTLFAAQPINDATIQWLVSSTKYSTQKRATTANTTLTKKPKDYANMLLAAFQQQFPDGNCLMKSYGKKTIGVNVGARANITCSLGGTNYVLSVFAFVHKLTYYSVMYFIPSTKFSKTAPKLDAITVTLVITK